MSYFLELDDTLSRLCIRKKERDSGLGWFRPKVADMPTQPEGWKAGVESKLALALHWSSLQKSILISLICFDLTV